MGKVASAIGAFAIVLCAILLGLMVAANEASKEAHVTGEVFTGLDGKAVQTKPVQSFGSLLDFPDMDESLLNELDYVTFVCPDKNTNDTLDMRFSVCVDAGPGTERHT